MDKKQKFFYKRNIFWQTSKDGSNKHKRQMVGGGLLPLCVSTNVIEPRRDMLGFGDIESYDIAHMGMHHAKTW
jgi:hypothetical protein